MMSAVAGCRAFFVLAALTALQNAIKIRLKKAGKDTRKVQSGCSEDCLSCPDQGCGRRFYDTGKTESSEKSEKVENMEKKAGNSEKSEKAENIEDVTEKAEEKEKAERIKESKKSGNQEKEEVQ